MMFGRRKLRKLTRFARNRFASVRIKGRGRKDREKEFGTIFRALNHYCTNTTLHGLRYVVDSDLHMIERFLWFVVFVVSTTIASNVIYSLALRYQNAPTSIGIESMHYETSNLPFPSVTLCPNDRVDWSRLLELEPRILPNDTNEASLEIFRKILGRLSMMSFGDFDELDFLRDRDVRNLSSIDITQVLREVMPSCEQFLTECWWRNGFRNCCDIFEIQKTEYGFCFSFNSQVTESPLPDPPTETRPRRATSYGEWSGIRVTMHLGNITKPPDSIEIDGIVVIINGPNVWPNSGNVIPAGSMASLSLDCISGYASERVLQLDKRRRPCQYDETGVYNQESCLALCKRYWVVRYCGCNPSFLFRGTPRFRNCTIEDFACLSNHNELFNDYIVHFDDDNHPNVHRMICKCMPECDYYLYNGQFSNVPQPNENYITLDVHYIGQTSFRYKTDIVITQMDLLVSFGSIIGLFLGGSLLSAVELVYYVIVTVFSSLRRGQRTVERTGRLRSNEATIVHATVLPILDYSPLKPRAKRIPVFANYGLAESNLNRY